jgi:hypothetical protein
MFLHIFSFKSPISGRFLSEKATLLCALSTHKGVRPDALVDARLPVETIYTENFSKNTIAIPDFEHWEGLNDRFAILHYDAVKPYSHRIDEIASFRRTCGRQALQSCLIWLSFWPPPTRWKIKRQFLGKLRNSCFRKTVNIEEPLPSSKPRAFRKYYISALNYLKQ